MSDQPGRDNLDAEIADALSELVALTVARFEDLARRLSLPAFCVKALHMLGSPMAMKDLGQRIHCDPSFVTTIADTLDAHGLGRRETDSRDRRIKNLVLTAKGARLRERVEQELHAFMPWASALDFDERQCLLRLVRKMITAEQRRRAGGAPPDATVTPRVAAGESHPGEVTGEPRPAARSAG